AQSFAGPDGIELPAVSVVASASSRSLAHDALQARGAPEPVESPVECLVERSRAAHAWLQVERLDDERSLAPPGLQIRAPDDPVAPEEGQDVVAVAALRRRLVQLDHMLEAEYAPYRPVFPEQVVERGEEERGGRRGAGEIDAPPADHRG